MKVKQYKPKDRLFSEQYIIDENGFITIPSTTLFNAGVSSDKEFVVLEKYSADGVYYIVPANFQYNEKEYGFLFQPEVENGDLKFNVEGLFEKLKPGDSVTLDVYEFQLTLYDRHNVVENKTVTPKNDSTMSFFKFLTSEDNPYALDPFTFKKNEKRLKKLDNLINTQEKEPSLEQLDDLFNTLFKEILFQPIKKEPKKDLLSEFIDDMLIRCYKKDGEKIIRMSEDELEQFVKDMTDWYWRIKKDKGE